MTKETGTAMAVTASNRDIAAAFERVADLLEIDQANPFRVRAYRNAARTVAELAGEVAEMLARDEDPSGLPGIGADLARKIVELVSSGGLAYLDELEARIPAGLTRLLAVPGLGPRRVGLLHRELGIESPEDLQAAAAGGRVRTLKGFGPKLEAQILASLEEFQALTRRRPSAEVEPLVEGLLKHLRAVSGVERVAAAGSFRRCRETVGDLDLLVTARSGDAAVAAFCQAPGVAKVLARGTTRASVVLTDGFQVDLRVVAPESWGAALHYFTGSKEHNVAVRKLAQGLSLKVNEYGVFAGQRRVAGATEEEVYQAVGLPWIPPELRENRGEIAAARRQHLPGLIALADIRGDLHAHTDASDGRQGLAEMAAAAQARGYAYLAVTEHSAGLAVANGLDARRLGKHFEAIARLNAGFRGFRLLKGVEVEILENGELELPGGILTEMDLVIGSIHQKFNLSEERQTERLIRAMDDPHLSILGHPTGRLLNRRKGYAVNLPRVIAAAAERGCALELNAHPDRLDLDDVHCRMAREMGVPIAISTDAHHAAHLDYMRFGIGQARRGWLTPADVLNTRSWEELAPRLRRR
jgi:DNA polymerase (family 10)